MRPFPKFLKNKAIDLDDFDDYGETIQFPKLYNISKSDAPNYVSFREAVPFVKQRPKAQKVKR